MVHPLLQSIQRRSPQVVLAVVVAMGIVGVVAFYLALRPCVLDIRPGQIAYYSLTTKILPEAEDAHQVLREERVEVSLLMLGADGLGALLVSSQSGRRGDLRMVDLRRTGQVLLRDGELSHDYGPAIGYFDFNLMSLPPGLDQAWDADIRYAYPPPDKRAHSTHIRRTHNGSRPRFRWLLPAIEWVDQAPPGVPSVDHQRYVQMQDVEMVYRFDSSRGIWQEGALSFTAGVETVDGLVRHRVEVSMRLERVETVDEEGLRSLRQGVLELQGLQNDVAHQRFADAMERLSDRSWARMPIINEQYERWYADVNAIAQSGLVMVQVGTLSAQNERAAQALRWQIIADGYPAVVQRHGEHLVVYSGPFAQRNGAVLADLRRRFGANKPFWVTVP